VSDLLLQVLAEACGIDIVVELALLEDEQVVVQEV
jgi:hypothetical protein